MPAMLFEKRHHPAQHGHAAALAAQRDGERSQTVTSCPTQSSVSAAARPAIDPPAMTIFIVGDSGVRPVACAAGQAS